MANTTGFISTTTFSDEVMSGTDFCDHVTAEDLSKGVGYFYERDSFGLVFSEICCQECKDKAKAKEAEVIVQCGDCKQSFPRKLTTEWRWYDFYAAQGDIPSIVCNTCWTAETHQQRMARDARDYNEEMGFAEDDDDDDDAYHPGPQDDDDGCLTMSEILALEQEELDRQEEEEE